MEGNWHEYEAGVSRGIQFLKIYVERLTVRAARLLVLPNSWYIEIVRNWLIEDAIRGLNIFRIDVQFNSAHQVRPEPVQTHDVFIRQNGVNPCRLEASFGQ